MMALPLVRPPLPSPYSAGIEAESVRQFFLGYPQRLPVEPEFVADGSCGWPGVVTQEREDTRPGRKAGFVTMCFPTGERTLIDADLVRCFFLQQAQIEPSLADVVANGLQFDWMSGWKRLFGG